MPHVSFAMEPRPVSCSSFVPLLRKMSYLILKRGFDLVFSLVLLVTCALLMAVIALVVWLDSPGKIIYTQIRLGYGGKPFTIYKIPFYAAKHCPRMMRSGPVKTTHALPALAISCAWPTWTNCRSCSTSLWAKWALLAPRPERPTVYDDLDGKVENFRSRMQVMPGLTGYAQVNGGYDLNPAEKLKYDLIYINHCSILFDLWCLLKTIPVVFTMKGAR